LLSDGAGRVVRGAGDEGDAEVVVGETGAIGAAAPGGALAVAGEATRGVASSAAAPALSASTGGVSASVGGV